MLSAVLALSLEHNSTLYTFGLYRVSNENHELIPTERPAVIRALPCNDAHTPKSTLPYLFYAFLRGYKPVLQSIPFSVPSSALCPMTSHPSLPTVRGAQKMPQGSHRFLVSSSRA